MKIQNYVKILSTTIALSALPLLKPPVYAQTRDKADSFEYSVPPKGTSNDEILKNAPDSEIIINGEKKNAAIVVDLNTNTLYKYNRDGKAECAGIWSGHHRHHYDAVLDGEIGLRPAAGSGGGLLQRGRRDTEHQHGKNLRSH